MPLIFSTLWAKAWPYIAMVGAVLAVLIGFYEKGRAAGSAAIIAKNQDALIKAQRKTLNELQTATDARDSVTNTPADRLRDRDSFSRD